MKLLCAILFLQTVWAYTDFRGYFSNSRVCSKWECLNKKFNFTDILPDKDNYTDFIKGLLPVEWHASAEGAVEKCYEPRGLEKYVNTCPGQSLLHCVVDRMVQECPSTFWNQDDGCGSVTSLAGNNYMFSQSRYRNMSNMPSERRFLPNFFKSRCCDLPQMFNESLLRECGFSEKLRYIYRESTFSTHSFRNGPRMPDIKPKRTDGEVQGQVYNFHLLPESTTSVLSTSTNVEDQEEGNDEYQDPLDCCEEIDDFVHPTWRCECDFKLKWDLRHRLTNFNYTEFKVSTNNAECEDLKPSSSCVLDKIGLLNQFGFIKHFEMKNRIRAYSNGKSSYLYAVFNSAFLNVPRYENQCDSPRKLFNLLDAMLVVCNPTKRRSNRQCNKIFTEIRDSVSDITKESLDKILNSQNQNVEYTGFTSTQSVIQPENLYFPIPSSHRRLRQPNSRIENSLRYDFGVLGLLGTAPPVATIDLKPKNKTLVLLPVYQRTPKNDPLAINSLHNDGVMRG
ncbi:uncharacterized protein LOC120629928 isoform X2 [Pararge aegeria]|uniref:uncharacterized protein LOC120629928 isoform X2 n=1 Tax=Pararge aegeria TaxID=116150 RepID=UPI0019D1CB6C|nr:uncharacterized protein LOC120629928 isoform X2 [Pararge aegeria]